MKVELIGLPGAGKSHLCSNVASLAERRGVAGLSVEQVDDMRSRVGMRVAKAGRAVGFSCLHPLVSLRLGRLVLASGQTSLGGLLTKGVHLLSELKRFGRRRPGVMVCDQGVVQAIWSIGFRASRPVVGQLLREAEPWLPETLVVVDAARARHLEQLTTRRNGHSLFDRLPPDELDAAIDRGAALLSELVDGWQQLLPDGACYRFTGERSPFELLELIVGR